MGKTCYKLPTGTRSSVVIGLSSLTSEKWKMFLSDRGVYWNYMAGTLARKRIFAKRPDLIDDAVNKAIARVARCLSSGHFVYKEAGKGYFRAFLKTVVTRTALDLYRKEKLGGGGSGEVNGSEMSPAEVRDLLGEDEADSVGEERTLDAYDKTAGVERSSRKGRTSAAEPVRLVSMEDLRGVFDEEGEIGSRDPAAMESYERECSERELAFLKRVRLHVFYLALGTVLSDDRVTLPRRRVLALRYLDHLKPARIQKENDFAHMKRNAFDQLMFQSNQVLAKRVLVFWKEVAPESCRDSEHRLAELWAALSNSAKSWKLVRELRRRADGPNGLETV